MDRVLVTVYRVDGYRVAKVEEAAIVVGRLQGICVAAHVIG